MKIKNLVEKAKTNRTHKSTTKVPRLEFTITLEYRPYADASSNVDTVNEYQNEVFYAFIENELVGDIYVANDGTFTMWSDRNSKLIEGLTDALHIERAHIDGNLTDNPID